MNRFEFTFNYGYPAEPDGEMISRRPSGMKIPGYGVWDGSSDMEFYHE